MTVTWNAGLGAHIVTGFDEASAVLREPGWSSDPRRSPPAPPAARDLPLAALLFMDPPDHTRLRRLIAPAFTPRAVERIRPRVASIVDAALDTLEETADLVADLGHLVPLAIIAELLDAGTDGAELFRAETPRLARMLEVGAGADDFAEAVDAFAAVTLFLVPLIDERRRHPGDDFISALLAVGDLTVDEVLATTVLLLAAGHETTANLIGNGALALMRHPRQLPHLFTDPARAVEELLRHMGPVRLVGRVALTGHLLGGHPIRAGEQVLVRIDAADRDPRRFPDPDRLDLTRSGPSHLAFGGGAHFCLGAALARLEAQETLTRLFARFPAMTPATGTPRWRDSTTFRALTALPVRTAA
ncbi:cytochrome P450 [Actinoallomurus sp. NBC_01490]|uniref:cytochrome P450 n=1 Tax=Actinoallomurus sp. NBC_01490 TaxID=2903557 RepID=UPI002E30F17B|nr:cytochrome P450 [Actinoallomurus sp. NBC_01490]